MVSYGSCPSWVSKVRGRKQGLIDGYNQGYAQAIQIHKELQTIEKEPQEDSIIVNLDIIVDKTHLLVSPDDYVIDKFRKKGYNCQDCRMAGQGHPDFIFRKGNEIIYVEVKSEFYGLSLSQAKWILQNKDKKVILYYVEAIDS